MRIVIRESTNGEYYLAIRASKRRDLGLTQRPIATSRTVGTRQGSSKARQAPRRSST
jgi:hypothetical protein